LLAVAHKHLGHCHQLWRPDVYERLAGPYIKGKSAIMIARQFGGRERNFTGENFWARGYFVSTVGLDEAMVRTYIRNQEQQDERYDQMKLGV
ncbi:transposase, partial [Xanthomonas theicola]|uniref:transposase n=1 Tax=Xanthomonas theicola TaxID=56464 RepID=UPI002012AEF4